MTLHNPVTQVVLPLFVIALMFALGTTLTHEDLTRVLRRPRGFVVGVLTHALLLPLLAFALAIGLALPSTLAVGLSPHRLPARPRLRPTSLPTSRVATRCSASA